MDLAFLCTYVSLAFLPSYAPVSYLNWMVVLAFLVANLWTSSKHLLPKHDLKTKNLKKEEQMSWSCPSTVST